MHIHVDLCVEVLKITIQHIGDLNVWTMPPPRLREALEYTAGSRPRSRKPTPAANERPRTSGDNTTCQPRTRRLKLGPQRRIRPRRWSCHLRGARRGEPNHHQRDRENVHGCDEKSVHAIGVGREGARPCVKLPAERRSSRGNPAEQKRRQGASLTPRHRHR
jgi:hypothetical protein